MRPRLKRNQEHRAFYLITDRIAGSSLVLGARRKGQTETPHYRRSEALRSQSVGLRDHVQSLSFSGRIGARGGDDAR
jgi:hypothetical protein